MAETAQGINRFTIERSKVRAACSDGVCFNAIDLAAIIRYKQRSVTLWNEIDANIKEELEPDTRMIKHRKTPQEIPSPYLSLEGAIKLVLLLPSHGRTMESRHKIVESLTAFQWKGPPERPAPCPPPRPPTKARIASKLVELRNRVESIEYQHKTVMKEAVALYRTIDPHMHEAGGRALIHTMMVQYGGMRHDGVATLLRFIETVANDPNPIIDVYEVLGGELPCGWRLSHRLPALADKMVELYKEERSGREPALVALFPPGSKVPSFRGLVFREKDRDIVLRAGEWFKNTFPMDE